MWRAVLAGAVIGLVEAAGLVRSGRSGRRPVRAVWLDDRDPADPLAGTGVWFLDPIGDPRPGAGDVRRRGDAVRLGPLGVRRIRHELRDRRS